VHVISPIAWLEELKSWFRSAKKLPASRRLLVDGITVDYPRYLYTPRILRGWYGDLYRASIRQAFDRVVQDFKPDLIFAAWAYPDGWAAIDLGYRYDLPVAIKVHGSDVLWAPRFSRSICHRTREALCRADAVVAVSHDLAEKVRAFGVNPNRISVLYDGVDLSRFYPGSRTEARGRLGLKFSGPVLLYAGRMVPVKGVDVFLKALQRLVNSGTQFQCVLIGEGPIRCQHMRWATSHGLNDHVRFIGEQPQHALPDWFRAADLFVLPSHSEGLPCVLLESIACGTRFVASRVGGIPELARSNHDLLFTPGDDLDLASKLRDAIQRLPQTEIDRSVARSHETAASELAEILDGMLHHSRIVPGPADCCIAG
jgi:glycosyltransferase involved in cell wall biosynthesis